MTTRSNSLKLADELAAHPYSLVGCYPLFAVTSDGGVLCDRCCATERTSIALTTGTDGWCVVQIAPNWENPALFCDHCGERIESAYAENDA
jgi:hypothetical protein